jgi:hypothetical protein
MPKDLASFSLFDLVHLASDRWERLGLTRDEMDAYRRSHPHKGCVVVPVEYRAPQVTAERARAIAFASLDVEPFQAWMRDQPMYWVWIFILDKDSERIPGDVIVHVDKTDGEVWSAYDLHKYSGYWSDPEQRLYDMTLNDLLNGDLQTALGAVDQIMRRPLHERNDRLDKIALHLAATRRTEPTLLTCIQQAMSALRSREI